MQLCSMRIRRMHQSATDLAMLDSHFESGTVAHLGNWPFPVSSADADAVNHKALLGLVAELSLIHI